MKKTINFFAAVNIPKYIAMIFFVAMSIWWVTIYDRGLVEGFENNAFTLIYPWMSLFGGIVGLVVAKKWGGFKSHLGKSLSFFSLGLLAQFLGQASYAYLIYLRHIEVPYPSIGDIGYFGSVILYIIGVYFLGRAIGVRYVVKSNFEKFFAFIFPALILTASYFIFLKEYVFDWSSPIRIFLDFGYPLGQAFYVALALLFLIVSIKHLGGKMKLPIMIILVTLTVQYFSDFMFLFQVNQGTWYVAGVNDYFYLISYFLMTMSLVYIEHTFESFNSNNPSQEV